MARRICKTIKENREFMKNQIGKKGQLDSKVIKTQGVFARESQDEGDYLLRTSQGNIQIPLRDIYYKRTNQIRANVLTPKGEKVNAYISII